MKEVLRDQNDAEVSVMAAFREQVAHLLGIDVVQQIVEDHEARSAASVFKKVCRDALVKMYVTLLRQFCRRRNRGLLAIAPYHPRRNHVLYTGRRGSAGTARRTTTCRIS